MRVEARIAVTLTERHAEAGGWPTREAEDLIHAAIAGAPAGATVRLDVGPVRYPSRRIVQLLTDALGPDAVLVIEGPVRAVEAWVRELPDAEPPPSQFKRAA